MKLPPPPPQAAAIRRRLLRFFDEQARDLPWRRTRDPYRVLVSEVMLQQTTVAAVIPYYERFVARFPDAAALAGAPETDVLAAWSGLGYYARARRLQGACREVVRRYGGRLPDGAEALLELPGIGPYTAGAVASIAFGRPEPVLDGNVARVLSRLGATGGQGAGERRRLLDTARVLVHCRRPGDLNQALMELGATLCTPRQPRCGRCPVSHWCRAARQGRPHAFPERRRSPLMQDVRGTALFIRDRGGVVLVRRPARPPLADLWELPGVAGVEEGVVDPTPTTVAIAAAAQLGRPVHVRESLGVVRHTVMNRRIRLEIRRGVLDRARRAAAGGAPPARHLPAALTEPRHRLIWRPQDWPPPALTGASRKVLTLLGSVCR